MADQPAYPSDPAGQDEAFGKKRPLDGPPSDGAVSKRAHVEDGDALMAIKMMASNKDAGTIIGRSGATINKMQQASGSRIRVSNAHEYFPGTGDRVVLVTGPLPCVAAGIVAVLNELYRDSESYQQVAASGEVDASSLTINLLVPDLSSGHIIGKGGENIRRMVEDSGAKIQLTAKEKQAPGTHERILSLIGSLEQVVRASELVVYKIWEDPKCAYVNATTNYKAQFGGMGGPPPRGGPGGPGGFGGGPMGGFGGPPPGGGYDMYASAYPPPDPYYHQQPPPYSDPFGSPYGQPSRPPPPAQGGPPGFGGPPPGRVGGFDPYPPAAGAPGSVTYQLHVPDHVVPAVLGRGGQVIKEMMDQSGAVIKVSQKGDYVPGTNNRIISITGSHNAASFAHQLVSAKIPQM